MATPTKRSSLYQLAPLTPEEVSFPNYPITTPPDILQLQADTANVVEGRVPLSDFDPDYQERIKTYYKTYGRRKQVGGMASGNPSCRMMRETLDLV
jgi:hypothetical protein